MYQKTTQAGYSIRSRSIFDDVSSATNASASLAKISAAIEQVAGDRAHGALQNRLEHTVSNLLNAVVSSLQQRDQE